MDDKKSILNKIIPVAVLKALTQEAEHAIPLTMSVEGFVSIRQFPFRVGRESRVQTVKGKIERIERPKHESNEPNNDLYLVDRGQLLNISREHFLIEKEGDRYLLSDRGSACGTKINDQSVGGNDAGGTHILRDGDEIVIGTKDSPYRFQFIDLQNSIETILCA
ncbi:MAG: FHA domain-containing protein [Desulfobulbaceae bacterium]|nr:MAG: FHA domain-containing protein [Desulfobulbaceae bacterium]